jgi:altronate dehydratase large subunit
MALTGLVNNPNVGAALLIGLGCEGLSVARLMKGVGGKPVEGLVIQESGGSVATKRKGTEIAERFLELLAKQRREPAGISKLIVATECGGSDALSGVTANPAVGAAADRVAAQGGTVLLSETTEMIGTVHILSRRGANPEISEQVEELVNGCEQRLRERLGDAAGMLLARGNIAGGLSSLTEKSLGCILKGGTTPIREVVPYGDRPSKPGLVIMDTPGYDISSMAGLAAGGAQVILFTTGRGSVAGCPAVPVIKIATNSQLFRNMPDDMDLNAGSIIDDDKPIPEFGQEIFDFMIEVANGRKTCAEVNRSAPYGLPEAGAITLKDTSDGLLH